MASRKFPRNNNRNSRSNNNRNNNNINCRQCGLRIPILNGDIQFSLNLHMQSHKSVHSIDQDIHSQLSRANLGPNVQRRDHSNYVCPECNENVQIFDGDIKRSLELHAQKHQRSGVRTRGDDQSSTSSGRSRNANRKQNYMRSNTEPTLEGMNGLDSVFHKMQPGLKAHRGFVYENEFGEVVCGLCSFKIDSVNKVTDHLVTKSHEDSTISFIKSKLPPELYETMEFVSFYGSNLCCNRCRCKIDLNSLNVSETIMNIIAHNAGQQHLNKRGRSESLDRSKEGMKKLNFLAYKDSLINNNKHLISCEIQPKFKCKLCDKLIPFDQNDQILLKNFTSHLCSNGHKKCVTATSVLTTFKSTYQPKGGKHNFVVTKGSITCTVCNISVEPSLDTLDAHVKDVDSVNIDWPEDLSERFNRFDFNGPQQSFNMSGQSINIEENKVSKLTALLKCMPESYRNVNYIVENSQGQVTCLVCNCAIPSTYYNLKTHLTGSSHMKNLSSTTDDLSEAKPSTCTTSAKSQNFNPFMKENSSETISPKGETGKDMSKVLECLKESNILIRKHVSMLTKHKDYSNYFCKLCKTAIPKSHDEKSFEQNLISHISGSNHMQLYAGKQESEMTKLLSVDPLVRANKNYIFMFNKIKESDTNECNYEKFLLCTLCNSQLTFSIDGTKLKKSLCEHLNGQQHVRKMEEVTMIPQDPKPTAVLSNSMESLKTQYYPSKDCDFANVATKSSNMFQTSDGQFKGPQDLSKAEKSNDKSPKSSTFLRPNPPNPLGASEFVNSSKSSNMFQTSVGQFKGPQDLSKAEESTSRLSKPSSFLLPNPKPLAVGEFASSTKPPNMFQTSVGQFKEPQDLSKPEESTERSQKPSSFLFPSPRQPFVVGELNSSTKSSNMFQTSVGQFKGPQDLSKAEEPTNKPQKNSPLLLNPIKPLGEKSTGVKPKDFNFETPKPKFPSSISTDVIEELFQKLPANFKPDKDFIKKSGKVEGFLACTLCNINHINPPYLQKHLEEEKHVQERIGRRLPSVQADTQNTSQRPSVQADTQNTSSKKMMHQMKNFFGFSN